MSPKKKKSGKKKDKKASSFSSFWRKLMKKDKKKGASEVTDETVEKAVSKVAKVLPLKKKERKQVTEILAAEVQKRAHETHQTHQAGHVKEGEDIYPVPIQMALFEQEQLDEKQKESLNHGESVSLNSASAGPEDVPVENPVENPAFGTQPDSIMLDKSALNEIKKHMLVNMLQEVMMEASMRQKPSNPNQKRAEEMNPDELIELRKTNMKEWEALVKENTVVSYALSKPSEKDARKAQKTKDKKAAKRTPLKFDDTVEVAKAPVGKDFLPNEGKAKGSDKLKRS